MSVCSNKEWHRSVFFTLCDGLFRMVTFIPFSTKDSFLFTGVGNTTTGGASCSLAIVSLSLCSSNMLSSLLSVMNSSSDCSASLPVGVTGLSLFWTVDDFEFGVAVSEDATSSSGGASFTSFSSGLLVRVDSIRLVTRSGKGENEMRSLVRKDAIHQQTQRDNSSNRL